MTNLKITRRKTLLLILCGISVLATSVPAKAQKKKRSRDRNRDRYRLNPIPDSAATPTPFPSPTPPSVPYTPPNPALIPTVAAGVFGGFGLLGAWLWSMNK